jgi:hypothetical protein
MVMRHDTKALPPPSIIYRARGKESESYQYHALNCTVAALLSKKLHKSPVAAGMPSLVEFY